MHTGTQPPTRWHIETYHSFHSNPFRGRITSTKNIGKRSQKVVSKTCMARFLERIISFSMSILNVFLPAISISRQLDNDATGCAWCSAPPPTESSQQSTCPSVDLTVIEIEAAYGVENITEYRQKLGHFLLRDIVAHLIQRVLKHLQHVRILLEVAVAVTKKMKGVVQTTARCLSVASAVLPP